MKSRFCFNLNLKDNFLNLFKIIFSKTNSADQILKKNLEKYFDNSQFFFFDYGRTALYEILSQIKLKTNKRTIIVNSFTLFEVINIIIYSGFKPLLADNQKNSFHTDIKLHDFKNQVDDLACIIITHLNGANRNIINLKKELDNYEKYKSKIYLVEDCAVSFGAKLEEKFIGSFGDFSFLSFNIMKNITSYTGGAMIINNKNFKNKKLCNKYSDLSKFNLLKKNLYIIIIQLLNHKILFPFFFSFVNFAEKNKLNFFLKKYRADHEIRIEKLMPKKYLYFLHEFQKNILINQFKNLMSKQLNRNQKSKIYFLNLQNINDLTFPQKDFDENNIFIEFPIICKNKEQRDNLVNYLRKNKIDIKNYYYKNCADENIYTNIKRICLNSRNLSENIIMLPVHEKIYEDDQRKIIDQIKLFFNELNG